jgi:hypothetical protein
MTRPRNTHGRWGQPNPVGFVLHHDPKSENQLPIIPVTPLITVVTPVLFVTAPCSASSMWGFGSCDSNGNPILSGGIVSFTPRTKLSPDISAPIPQIQTKVKHFLQPIIIPHSVLGENNLLELWERRSLTLHYNRTARKRGWPKDRLVSPTHGISGTHGTLIRFLVRNYKNRVDHAREIRQCEEATEDSLKWLPAEQDGKRWEKNGDQVHVAPATVGC